MSSAPATIKDILPSACALLGVPGTHDRLGLVPRFGDARRVAVFVVDGMGYRLLPALAPHAPLLASVLRGTDGTLDELSCEFPSTTPTSLVSLGTGMRPGVHGILGFTVNVPGTDRVLTHITWRDDPAPDRWQPVPTLFERAARAGTSTAVVLPSAFEGSGLTTAAYRGARYCGLGKREDAAARVLSELRARPGLVYGYDSSLDTAAHVHGIASSQWAQAARSVDALLARIVADLPDDAVLLVTADHGGLDVPGEGRFDVGTDARLAAGVRVVAGEPRVRYLHTVDGSTPDVIAAWTDVLGDQAMVRSREELIDDDWFGPVPASHRARIGDVVVVCQGAAVVLASDREPAAVSKLIGFHGAVTPEETAIPLIAFGG
jgi:hypothetical protein